MSRGEKLVNIPIDKDLLAEWRMEFPNRPYRYVAKISWDIYRKLIQNAIKKK
jgi:hypothetical protein